ncbi:MAG TPA: hypothetical protein VJ385_05060 [Fibrobacteria bacterium]|nr:hypothetical protein [Fibrobacteria bacterium]
MISPQPGSKPVPSSLGESRPEAGPSRAGDVSAFGTFLAILFLRRVFFVGGWAVAFFGSILLAFLLPKEYKTETTFQINTQGGMKLGLPEGLKMLDPRFNSSGGGTALALSILDSRKLAMTMIEMYHLKKEYRTKWDHLAIKKFRKKFEYDVFDEGIVQISFIHSSPDTARLVADSILAYLNRESILYSTHKARQEFEFNRTLVDSVYANLDSLSRETIAFMNRTRIVDFERHVELSLKSYAKIQENLTELEGEFALAKIDNSKTPQDKDNLKTLIGMLRRKQGELSHNPDSRKGFNFAMNYDSIPTMTAFMAKIDLNIEKNKTMLKVLLPKLEDSRIKTIETVPVLNVIDPSFTPPYKNGPKRALIIVFVTLGAGLLWTLLLGFRELAFNPRYRPASLALFLRKVRELQ